MGSLFSSHDADANAREADTEQKENLPEDELMVKQMRARSNVIHSGEFFSMMKENNYSERASHIAAYILAKRVNCHEDYYVLRRGLSILGVKFLRTLVKIVDQGIPDLRDQDPFFHWRRQDFKKIKIRKKDLINNTNEHRIFLANSEHAHYAIVIINDNPMHNKCDIEKLSQNILIVGLFNARPFVQIQESINE